MKIIGYTLIGLAFLLLLCSIPLAYRVGRTSGEQEQQQAHWKQIRETILTVPTSGRPPSKVIPELGVRMIYQNWDNGPVLNVIIEDMR